MGMLTAAIAIARDHAIRAENADRRRADIRGHLDGATTDPAWLEPQDPETEAVLVQLRIDRAEHRAARQAETDRIRFATTLAMLAIVIAFAIGAILSHAPVRS